MSFCLHSSFARKQHCVKYVCQIIMNKMDIIFILNSVAAPHGHVHSLRHCKLRDADQSPQAIKTIYPFALTQIFLLVAHTRYNLLFFLLHRTPIFLEIAMCPVWKLYFLTSFLLHSRKVWDIVLGNRSKQKSPCESSDKTL